MIKDIIEFNIKIGMFGALKSPES